MLWCSIITFNKTIVMRMSLLFARRYHVSILISALVLLATMAMTSHYDFGIGGFLGKATRLRGRSINDRGLVRKLMGTSKSTSKKLDSLIDEEDAFRVLEHSSEDSVEEDVDDDGDDDDDDDDDGDDDDDDDMVEGNSEEDEKEEESEVEESEGEEMMGEDSAEEVSEESESEEEESEEAESVEENEVSEEEESVEKESKQEETEEEGEKPVGNIGEEEENEEEATQTTSAKKKEEEGNEPKSEEQEAKATPEPEYTPTDDDPIQIEDESIVEQVEQELEREEKVARTAGGFGIFLAIGAMIFTAHQMSENPDGIFAR